MARTCCTPKENGMLKKGVFLFCSLLCAHVSAGPLVAAEHGSDDHGKEASGKSSAHSDKGGNDKNKTNSAQAQKEEKAKSINKTYVQLPPFQVPVIQGRVHRANFLMDIIIEAQSARKALKIYDLRARLIDRIFADLYSVFAVIWHPDFHIALEPLKERIFKICLDVLGQDLMRDVLIQNFTFEHSSSVQDVES